MHALYGFARYADEIVDNGDPATMADEFKSWEARVTAELESDSATDPVCRAMAHTLKTWKIPLNHVRAFLDSMRADLTVSEYETYEDLRGYMYGSAAVIGLQMLPILEPAGDDAYEPAQALGEAFQLTNFIRDIAEDLAMGRVYLPQEDLGRFGVTKADLVAGVVTPEIKALLCFQIDRARKLYVQADTGIRMLHPSSRPCIETARALYSGILTVVERADYRIFDRRVTVGLGRRVATALPAYLRARRHWKSTPPPVVGSLPSGQD